MGFVKRACLMKHWPCCQKWKTMVASEYTIICALFDKDENDKAEKMIARGLLLSKPTLICLYIQTSKHIYDTDFAGPFKPWEGIRKQWLNYVETATHSLEHPKQTLEIMIKWQPPSQGWFSINTDDKVQGQDGIVGCGGLIRDANGHVCGFAKTNKLVLDLHCGAYEGLCMAQNRGLTAVGLKMDAQTVSQSLERTQEGCSSRRVV
ncbi:uncharacterized protein LOC114390034 [Glycine soja]|uniref:uncharacterized protein n=1 Tax=Glycine max TaxID=3847 RepID=UPI00023D619E|nr:uncharacterized protein LOC106796487 [Glycine max]XP_028206521.1 uncharacterized protein LOC114390034 [Glycine soja]|eukprot:XP_014624278.1 uncharacterized protein LOC106796487 [Glycine max]